jgi:hypothetical protein
MKYLLTACAILAALLAGLLLAPLLTPRVHPVKGALVVNQRIYTPGELSVRMNTTAYHFDNKKELIANLVYRELLLQEARLEKIDREEAFRTSMRDFFEQSMIKTLLDRQYKSAKHEPNPAQISACMPLLSHRFTLKRIDYPDQSSALSQSSGQEQTFEHSYLDLPEETRAALLNLKGGELSPPLHNTGRWFRLQLLAVVKLDPAMIPTEIEQEVLCRQELKRQSMQNWVENLYRKSDITLPDTGKAGNNG